MHADDHPTPRSPQWLLASMLAAGTLAAFAPLLVGQYEFILYDDHLYVTQNPMVLSGINAESLRWSLTAIVAANWHPLTVLSHMLDVQIFGAERPWGHHLTNLILHTTNVVLLFVALRGMTGAVWRSALVAALFAWHPLRVESVAWVAERKDVLSGLFFMLTLLAYGYYARRRSVGRYLLVALSLTLGLLSKPMLVTLPCVLLLLDAWPLGRLPSDAWLGAESRRAWGRLFLEKVPLFVIVALFSAVTLWAQQSDRAVASTDWLPIDVRVANALMSYNQYVSKMLYPHRLAVLYPIQTREFHILVAVLAALGLGMVTLLALRAARQRPYLAVGWLWYLGTLVPVIGLVQVGNQSMADRYTYLPLIGLFLIVAWGLGDVVAKGGVSRRVAVAGSILALAVLAVLTARQVAVWKNTETLFLHAIESTRDNYIAHQVVASYYHSQQRWDEAVAHLTRSLEIAPSYAQAHHNLGEVLRRRNDPQQNDLQRAIQHFNEAQRLGHPPGTPAMGIALCLLELEYFVEAEQFARAALLADPTLIGAYAIVARSCDEQGKWAEAIEFYQRAIRLTPNDSLLLSRLAAIYATSPAEEFRDGAEAVRLAEAANERYFASRGFYHPMMLDTLAAAYAEVGDFERAEQQALGALQIYEARAERGDDRARQRVEETAARLKLYRSHQPYRQPIVQPRQAASLDELLRGDD